MQFKKLTIRAFGGIKEADIDLAPGLNVLFGPNELGKSTLVQAIRAALLLPHSSTAHRPFVDWHDDRPPRVAVTFEQDDQRIYRVSKTFGTGSDGRSTLEFSRDGISFSPEVRGREVDGKLRELLSWGVGSPGGSRGRAKGLPDTFLSTALLGSQDEVKAVLEKSIEDDLDESGRDLLTHSLQAIAESPVFRRVLESTQDKVELAFSPTGQKRRAKGSPWTESRERITTHHRELAELRRQGDESSSTRDLTIDLRRQLEGAEDRVRESKLILDRDEEARNQTTVREEANMVVRKAIEDRDRIQNLHSAVEETTEHIRVATDKLESAEESHEEASGKLSAAAAELRQAEKRAEELESGAAEQKRKIRRQELDNKVLSMTSDRKNEGRTIELANDALTKAAKAAEASAAVEEIEADLRDAETRIKPDRMAIETKREALAVAEQVALFVEHLEAEKKLATARQDHQQVEEWRKEAAGLRAQAAKAREAIDSLELPSEAELGVLRDQQRALHLAEAKLQVAIQLRITPHKPLELRAAREGEPETITSLTTLEAEGTLQVSLEGIADLDVLAGSAELRKEAEQLRSQWESSTVGVFERLGVADLEGVDRLCHETDGRRDESYAVDSRATEIEAKAEGRSTALPALEVLEECESTASRAVEAIETAKKIDADELRRRYAEGELESVDTSELRDDIEVLEQQTRQLEDRITGGRARLESHHRELAALAREAEEAAGRVSGTPEVARDDATARRDELTKALEEIQAELGALDGMSDAEVGEAREAISTAKTAALAAQEKVAERTTTRDKARETVVHLKGELAIRKDLTEAEDLGAAETALTKARAALEELPVPACPVEESQLQMDREDLRAREATADDLRRQLIKAEGALEQVGGESIKERIAEAEEALLAANKNDQEVELEYGSWQLLLKTLKEAEAEDAVHLGNSLVGPVSDHMRELTRDRYDSVSLGPDLSDTTVRVAGAERNLDLLSIGTRDQLATLVRLAVAKTVQSAVVLDDQLVHSDPGRMSWLSELMYECAEDLQILVLTCRPEEYELPDQTSRANWIDLEKAIERTHGIATP